MLEDIKKIIFEEFPLSDQQTIGDFIGYLEENGLSFVKDNSAYWVNKWYYWVQYHNHCVCYISIMNSDESKNLWTVWSDDIQTDWIKETLSDKSFVQIGLRHVDQCAHCGSCPGGKEKVIFGHTFDAVCGCTFRVDNPQKEEVNFLKKLIQYRIKDIDKITEMRI